MNEQERESAMKAQFQAACEESWMRTHDTCSPDGDGRLKGSLSRGMWLTQKARDHLSEMRSRNFWRRMESYVWTVR